MATTDHPDSFDERATVKLGAPPLEILRLDALQERVDVGYLPFSTGVTFDARVHIARSSR
jgi:hypothetical protein